MNLALFDFDGTVTTGNTYSPFMRYVSRPARVRQGRLAFAPWLLGYRLGLVPGAVLRTRVSQFVLGGRRAEDIRRLGERYAREVLPGVLRPQAMARIAWHQARGDRVVLVSASLDAYLAPWCREHGIDLICSELEAVQGMLTGRYRHGDCAGPAKAARVRERYRLADYPMIHAYGDTREDREMLALAHCPVFRWRQLAPV